MTHRFSASLLTFTSALCLVSGGVQAATPELSFYPTGGWEISSDGFCTVRGTFNNGFVMDINGNEKGLSTMSVDFRQDVFESQKTYPVTLSTPNTPALGGKGFAPSAAMLNIGLEGQETLLSAMKNSATLDMGVEKNKFRFYLVGFSSAGQKLEECMQAKNSTLTAAAPLEPTPAPAPAPETVIEMTMTKSVSAPTPEPEAEIMMESGQAMIMPATGPEAESENIVVSTRGEYKRLSEQLDQEMRAGPQSSDEAVDMEGQPAMYVPGGKVYQFGGEKNAPPAGDTLGEEDMMTPMPVMAEEITAPPPPPADVDPVVSSPSPESSLSEPASEVLIQPAPDTSYKMAAEEADRAAQLERENAALKDELSVALEESKTEEVAIRSDNWDLEKATARYNEAERQVQILGQKLQRERAVCEMEKKELETMLFDPQVTTQQQMARLAELEAQLAESQKELELQRQRYDERIRALEAQGQ